jgi:predicted RNA-binding protein with PIN domain
MVLLIDGYNLLRNIFHKQKGKLDKQRKDLIQQLSYYKKKKNLEIVLVFDGGLFNHATREIRGGVAVIFSGQHSNADDWIYKYVNKNKEKEILLVTQDRELINRCGKHNVDSLDVADFYKLLQDVLIGETNNPIVSGNTKSVQKYDHEIDDIYQQIDREGLDLLMSQSDVSSVLKDDEVSKKIRKSKSKTLSKKEKKILNKLKKL